MAPIATSHAGSLPRSAALLEANARGLAESDPAAYEQVLANEVDAVVRRQRDIGLTVVNDGEYGKAMSAARDFGAWWTYSFVRVGGLKIIDHADAPELFYESKPGDVRLSGFKNRRDWARFSDVYTDPETGAGTPVRTWFPQCVEPLTYTGTDLLRRDITNVTAALDAQGIPRSEGFLTAIAPGSAARVYNAYYPSEEAFIDAWADVLHEEYAAILDAGLRLQIDDPSLAESYDQITPSRDPRVGLEPAAYREFIAHRAAAINRALEGLDRSRVRLHICWGSWHGPHSTDIGLADILPVITTINVGEYSFEAGNARHEHEWKVWRDADLPENTVLVPGVVSHATNVIEHPDLVAERIERFAGIVGADRVVAATDCGFGGRIHPSLAWAKLEALAEGARRVTGE